MFKTKKWWALSLAVLVVSLFVPSCDPIPDDPVENEYTVNIVGGTMEFEGPPPITTGIFEAGDIVVITANDPAAGKVFAYWTTSPSVAPSEFNDVNAAYTTFRVPAFDVTITAVFEDDDWIGEDGTAEVRFTWESAVQASISSISASYDDVKYWFEEVYSAADYVQEDATDIPMFDGSPLLPNNIYSSTVGSTVNKGKYFPIEEGFYTAVCTVEDEHGFADIVANYFIMIDEGDVREDGIDLFYEIAFDVNTFIDGECGGDEDCWMWDVYDNPDDDPILQKAKKTKKITKKIVKKDKTIEVTYYVLYRLKK